MANNRVLMRNFANPTGANIQLGIQAPALDANVNFEVKHGTIQLVQQNHFGGAPLKTLTPIFECSKSMVTTRRGSGSSGGEDQEIPNLRDIIASQVGEVLHSLFPGLFDQMKREMTELDPIISSRWVSKVEGAFLTSFSPAEVKVRFAANLLRKAAKDWWNVVSSSRTPEQVAAMTWEEFKGLFKAEFEPQVEIERLTNEFLYMKQTTESVSEITEKFLEKSRFCPNYVADETMKMYRYGQMLKAEIREFVLMANCTNFQQMFERARAREIELER
ncbi:hypothetical protein OSB04_019401 [Centaurea solstitialis]|uniref:Retrotransposon gag domain-containing protein n=1 Tax=Centaurea solstitialis TaxID=347529 RepID=A0AA38SXW8_9ASTR|nr:hypothetical protein OSB04_019401 [Centaurea solstitialis]